MASNKPIHVNLLQQRPLLVELITFIRSALMSKHNKKDHFNKTMKARVFFNILIK